MLLKVEVTGTSSADPLPALYASPASASHHSNGVLFTVGRKNADIVFEKEKSVSRAHCSLRLITSKKVRGKADDGNHAAEAKTKEEIEACEASEDGLAIVLDDLGR